MQFVEHVLICYQSYGEEVLEAAIGLLKSETDKQLIKTLTDYATDDSIEGSEAQKNHSCSVYS